MAAIEVVILSEGEAGDDVLVRDFQDFVHEEEGLLLGKQLEDFPGREYHAVKFFAHSGSILPPFDRSLGYG